MRPLVLLLLLSTPVLAGDWTAYENPRLGFTIEVPAAGWTAQPPPQNGDGQAWYSDDGRSTIVAWGSTIDGGFAADVASRVAADREKGWTITSEADWNMDVKQGPEGWHVYSGSWDGRAMQQKSIVTCGGAQAVHVRLEYFESQFVEFLEVTEKLITSLKPPAGGCAPG